MTTHREFFIRISCPDDLLIPLLKNITDYATILAIWDKFDEEKMEEVP